MDRILKFKYILSFVLVQIIFLSLVGCGKKEEDYRQIQVYKIEGTAKVARQGNSMDVYENMQLQSGDMIETIAESYLQLKLDEDKYILVEPDSKISLQATGNSVDSKTKINLEKGAIVNQLDNPLSKDSSYEVTTPNSTMAVRGTTFRVELTVDEKGETHAKVAVYGGKVECNLVFPDGTIKEPVMVEAGTEVLVWGDDVESEYVWSGKTDYEELKWKVIDFLGVIIDRGEELSITKEEIEVLKEAKELLEQEENDEDKIGEQEENSEEETEDDKSEEENTEEENLVKTSEQREPETSDSPTEQTKEDSTQEDSASPTQDSNEENTNSGDEGNENTGGGNTGGGNAGGGNTGGGNTGGGDTGGGENGGDDTPGDDTPGDDTPGDDTPGDDDKITSITVEFNYNGPFASGSMEPNTDNIISVSCPILMPTRKGYWRLESEGQDAKTLRKGEVVEIDVSGLESVVFAWIAEDNT